jgi:hypothetical protein
MTLKREYWDDDEHSLTFERLTKEEAQEIIEKIMFPKPVVAPTPEPIEREREALAAMPYYKQQALAKALRLFYESKVEKDTGNKIAQIKFLRALSDLSLRESKEVVEYVLWAGFIPTYWKSEEK